MKNPDIYFNVTDYTPRFIGNDYQHHFSVKAGRKASARKANHGGDDPDELAYIVGERFLRGRYVHLMVIQFLQANMDVAENLIRDYREDLRNSLDGIIEFATSKYPDTLIISSVARDVWKHGGAYEFIGTDMYEPFFEQCGFKDISYETLRGDKAPHLTMVYVENMGGNGIINNFEWFW